MNDTIRYEMAQAQVEDQMRKAAVWRMQRAAMDGRKRATKSASAKGSWLNAIRNAFSGKTSAESASTQRVGESSVVYVNSN